MDKRRMSSVEADFTDRPGDGPPGAFIVWLVPIFWPLLIARLLPAIVLPPIRFTFLNFPQTLKTIAFWLMVSAGVLLFRAFVNAMHH